MNWKEFIDKKETSREEILRYANSGYDHPNGDEIVTVEHQMELVSKIFRAIDDGLLVKEV